jgi:hypothetical protein
MWALLVPLVVAAGLAAAPVAPAAAAAPAGPADVGPPPLELPAIGADGLPEVAEHWDGFADMRWAGPLFRPNRLQDWRVADHRVWCTEPRLVRGVRTLMGVAMRVDPAADPGLADVALRARVRVGTGVPPGAPGRATRAARAASDAPDSANASPAVAWRGLIVGVGGPAVDPWISGLVHQRAGTDGGILAVVDAFGRPSFRDFETPVGGAGGWSLPPRLPDGEAAPLAGMRVLDGPAAAEGAAATALRLELEVARDEDGSWRATLHARLDDGRLVATATIPGVDPADFVGAVGLVSHGRDGGAGSAHWFDDLRVAAPTLVATGARFGPVLSVHHVTDGRQVRAVIQCVPLGPDVTLPLTFAVTDDAARAADAPPWVAPPVDGPDPDAWTARVRVARRAMEARVGGTRHSDIPFTIGVRSVAAGAAELPAPRPGSTVGAGVPADGVVFRGRVRGAPRPGEPVVIGSLNCQKSWTGGRQWNERGVWYPHREIVDGLIARDPDLLVFTGDQLYEGDVSGAVRTPVEDALLDYLDKWFRFCTSFAPVTATRPTITIPDDHDVYHGNIWGDGGVSAVADPATGTSAQDAGGYVMPLRFVRAVHRSQVGHLQPHRPDPIGMGIVPWTSRVEWAGVSLAIVADRMFKSPPRRVLPDADVRNGWARAPGFDPRTQADPPDAEMLGAMQEDFLRAWATDFRGDAWAKILVSATPLANVATLPPGGRSGAAAAGAQMPEPGAWPRDWTLAADMDSGGWPPSGRDRAIAAVRPAGAIHLCGDQHLGMLLQYGLERPRDAGFAFCSPAIANAWPRRWHPPVAGANREPGMPPWTGDHRDGFDNLVTVWAVANPARSGREPAALHDTMPGWGAVVLDRAAGTVRFECHPRGARPGAGDADDVQYAGWPRTVHRLDGMHAGSGWSMPPVIVEDVDEPVLIVRDEAGVAVSAARLRRGERLPVPGRGPWTIELGEPDTDRWRVYERIIADPAGDPSEVFIVRWE